MAEHFVTCPLCGLEFQPADTLCQHGCPLHTACGLIRCPACEYEFPEAPRSVSWFRRLFGRAERCESPGGVRTVRDLGRGERAEIVHLADVSSGRSNALAVFGLVPGSEVTLLQRLPSYVLQVGETVLALEEAVASSIVVRPTARDAASSSANRQAVDEIR
jgi:Fe2+ transport system protein FeoA